MRAHTECGRTRNPVRDTPIETLDEMVDDHWPPGVANSRWGMKWGVRKGSMSLVEISGIKSAATEFLLESP